MAAKLIKTFEELMALPAGTIILAQNFQTNPGDHTVLQGYGLAVIHNCSMRRTNNTSDGDEVECGQLMGEGGILLHLANEGATDQFEEIMMGSFITETGETFIIPFRATDFGQANVTQLPYCKEEQREKLYALDGAAAMKIIVELFRKMAGVRRTLNAANESTADIITQELIPKD